MYLQYAINIVLSLYETPEQLCNIECTVMIVICALYETGSYRDIANKYRVCAFR